MSGKFRIQRYRTTVTIASSGTTANDPNIANPAGINGNIRAIKVVAPAMTGTTVTLTVLDDLGDTIFSLAAIPVNAKTLILKDVNNNNLIIPVASPTGVPFCNVLSNGTEASQRVLTIDFYIERG